MQAVGWELTCTSGGSYKYYFLAVVGTFTVTQYGRIGDVGSATVADTGSVLAAQDAAWAQTRSKLRKYVPWVQETRFEVDPDWLESGSVAGGRAIRWAFDRAHGAGTAGVRGCLDDGDGPHVVALRRWAKLRPLLQAPMPQVVAAVEAAAVRHRNLELALAVLDPAVLRALDTVYQPRLALTDLGPAQAGDTAQVLGSALVMFDPAGRGDPLSQALHQARLIHA